MFYIIFVGLPACFSCGCFDIFVSLEVAGILCSSCYVVKFSLLPGKPFDVTIDPRLAEANTGLF